jgi:hypothetical protein
VALALNRLFAPDLSYEGLAGEPLPGESGEGERSVGTPTNY